VDTSGSADDSARLAYPLCHTAVIVTNQTEVSIRAAESTGYSLACEERKDMWMVINNFETDLKKGTKTTVKEIIDRTRLSIIGIVPRDEQLVNSQESGQLVYEIKKSSNMTAAFDNIAARMAGKHVPLFTGMKHINKGKEVGRRVNYKIGLQYIQKGGLLINVSKKTQTNYNKCKTSKAQ
jgi:septum formation inhibitor-activating ATPase MinD